MKLSFTEKLVLHSIEKTGTERHIYFASYLREDFISRSLKLSINENNRINEINFSSNDYGTAVWKNSFGLIESHR